MKLVKVIPWDEGECEAQHKKPVPSIVQVGIKGINFHLCAQHAAQLIGELSRELGDWAEQAVNFQVGYYSGDPDSNWPPDTTACGQPR